MAGHTDPLGSGWVDENELFALISEAEQILADEVVIIPLYARLTTMAYWGDEVGGVVVAAPT